MMSGLIQECDLGEGMVYPSGRVAWNFFYLGNDVMRRCFYSLNPLFLNGLCEGFSVMRVHCGSVEETIFKINYGEQASLYLALKIRTNKGYNAERHKLEKKELYTGRKSGTFSFGKSQ